MATTTEIIRPPEPPGAAAWLKNNLFSNWYNSLLTIVSFAVIAVGLAAAARWVFFQADWTPITSRPLLYMVGQYPRDHLWRIGAVLAVFSLLLGISWRIWGGVMRTFTAAHAGLLLMLALWPSSGAGMTPAIRFSIAANIGLIAIGFLAGGLKFLSRRALLIAWMISPLLFLVLLRGLGFRPLPVIPTTLWGGFLVTLILSVGGIVLSFPIGVLLALGRRSSLPVVSWFSTAFIEIVRGVPLIGILFLASIMLPLFLPLEVRVDRLLRALAGMTIFSAAYMAENVRGGLAAIPAGQIEAAKALGLNSLRITMLIVLPQALRIVIPPIVGQFISLFKDTTLAAGVGVLEFLSVGRSILQANPEFIGRQAEVYLFIAVVFWFFSYLMSYASRKLEARLGVGER